MKTNTPNSRVRASSAEEINREIDQNTLRHIAEQRNFSDQQIAQRLKELQQEWDIERTLEANAAAVALSGVLLAAFVNKKWLILPSLLAAFLLQHAIQGWCPPLPLFRKMGIRTRKEIDEEIYALKVLRGDFEQLSPSSNTVEIWKAIRK